MNKAKQIKVSKTAATLAAIRTLIASPVVTISAGIVGIVGAAVTYGEASSPTDWALLLAAVSGAIHLHDSDTAND